MRNSLARLAHRLYRSPTLLLALAALFWAGNTVSGRLAVDEITPLMLTSLRWVLVIAVLWPIHGAEVRRHWPAIRPKIGTIALMAALGFTAFNVMFYIAAYYTSAVNLGILQGAIPVFVLAGAFLYQGTRVSALQLVGVLATTVGVLVVATRGDPLSVFGGGWNRGDVMMIVSCVFYAFYTVALRERPDMPSAVFFTLLALIAALTSLPLVAYEVVTGTLRLPSLQGFLVTLYVAIFPSFISQIFWLRGVDLIGPGRAGVYVNLVPVFSAILAVALLSEHFAAFHAVALVLVIGGILLAQRTPAQGGNVSDPSASHVDRKP